LMDKWQGFANKDSLQEVSIDFGEV
jgi:hypothetical protein